jgi:hypothetical protein
LILADNQAPLEVLVVGSIVVPLLALAAICWIFWKARDRP